MATRVAVTVGAVAVPLCRRSVAAPAASASGLSSSRCATAHLDSRRAWARSLHHKTTAASSQSSTPSTENGFESVASATAAAWSASHSAHYTPLSLVQRSLLFTGSSVLALLNPYRSDLVAAVGEVAPGTTLALNRLHRAMLTSEGGRWLLEHKPRIRADTVNIPHILATYDPRSFGYAYAKFMTDRKYSQDERTHVRFIADPELAYIVQRYREIHDLLHVLTDMPTTVLGELGQKVFEAAHFRLTMPTLSAIVAPPLTLAPHDAAFYYAHLVPWSLQQQQSLKVPHLITVRFESLLHRPLEEVREELGILAIPKELRASA